MNGEKVTLPERTLKLRADSQPSWNGAWSEAFKSIFPVSPGFSKLGMRIFLRTFMDSRGAMNGSLSLELGWDMMPPSPLAHVTYPVVIQPNNPPGGFFMSEFRTQDFPTFLSYLVDPTQWTGQFLLEKKLPGDFFLGLECVVWRVCYVIDPLVSSMNHGRVTPPLPTP